jgi:hypothetical protein
MLQGLDRVPYSDSIPPLEHDESSEAASDAQPPQADGVQSDGSMPPLAPDSDSGDEYLGDIPDLADQVTQPTSIAVIPSVHCCYSLGHASLLPDVGQLSCPSGNSARGYGSDSKVLFDDLQDDEISFHRAGNNSPIHSLFHQHQDDYAHRSRAKGKQKPKSQPGAAEDLEEARRRHQQAVRDAVRALCPLST